jgi:hypothetical protein
VVEFNPEDGGVTFLRNVGNYLQGYTASQPRGSKSTFSPPSGNQTSAIYYCQQLVAIQYVIYIKRMKTVEVIRNPGRKKLISMRSKIVKYYSYFGGAKLESHHRE